MKIVDCMYGWNPQSDEIKVFEYPDKTRLSAKYQKTGGGCYKYFENLNDDQKQREVLSDALKMIVEDGVNSLKVHEEFQKIDEYIDAFKNKLELIEDN